MLPIRNAALSLLPLLASDLAAQAVPPVAKAMDAAAIEKEYRRLRPYSSFDFTRVDRPPFVFFVEKRDGKDMTHLADQRSFALNSIVELFERDFAKPLKLTRRKRPLPYWILASRKSYEKVGGSKFAAAHFDFVSLHTITFQTKGEQTRQAFHTAMHEAVHQIMFAYTDPDMSAIQSAFSSWVAEGMAEHLASRPAGAMLKGRDPGFGALDARKIAEVQSLTKKPFKWKRKSRLSWVHHPLYVMTYKRLDRYMSATGFSPKDGDEYHQQMGFFYRSAYSIVSFLDKGFKGHYRPKLREVLALEYAGKHGSYVINKVFDDEAKAALPILFRLYALSPKSVIGLDPPKITTGAAPVASSAKSKLFEDPDGGSYAGLKIKTRGSTSGLALPKAVVALRELDLDALAALAKRVDGEAAEPLRAARAALVPALAAYAERIAAAPKKVRLFLPKSTRGSRYESWNVESYRAEDRTFLVSKGADRKSVPLRDVPPFLLAESVERAGVALDDAAKRAFGLCVGVYTRLLDDRSAIKRVEKRAKRKGFVAEAGFVDDALPLCRVMTAFDDALSELLVTKDPEAILESLAKKVSAARPSPALSAIVKENFVALLDAAFARSPDRVPKLNGKVERLDGGRLRVTYDWTSADQLEDWLVVDPKKEGFGYVGGFVPSKGGRADLDLEEGQLQIFGQLILRHRIQFEGDHAVSWVVQMAEVDTEDGPRNLILPAGHWLVSATRPSNFLVADGAKLRAVSAGRQRRSRSIPSGSDTPVFDAITHADPLRLERRGHTARFLAGGEVVAEFEIEKKHKVPAEGAVLLVQALRAARKTEEGETAPHAAVGRVVVEGRPHPAAAGGARKRFDERWTKRFGL